MDLALPDELPDLQRPVRERGREPREQAVEPVVVSSPTFGQRLFQFAEDAEFGPGELESALCPIDLPANLGVPDEHSGA